MAFEDIRIHVRLKLLALWSSLMFFYIYADSLLSKLAEESAWS
jgi:hypothetical protein